MRKKTFIFIIFIAILGIITFLAYNFIFTGNNSKEKGFDIQITNATNKVISDIYFTCRGIKQDIKLTSLKKGKDLNIKISPKYSGENDISLYYFDYNHQKHAEVVIGYFEGSYADGKAKVRIESIDKNGILNVKTKYKFMGLYDNNWVGDEF